MISNLLVVDHFILGGMEFKNSISIGPIHIMLYALAIVTGMITCCLVAIPLFKKRGDKPDFILDLMICIVPCCIVGARLWYVIFDIKSFIKPTFWESVYSMIAIWEGGLAIYGGVAGGALGVFIACKIRKVSVIRCFDYGATMLPLGQAIGRWGNFFNQEVYGQKITNPSLQFFPLAVQIDTSGSVEWYQALFFYESMLNLLAFAVLYIFLFKRKGSSNGYSTGMYFIAYGIIRGILENFRQAEYNLPLFGNSDVKIPAMVLVSILLVIAGAVIIVIRAYKDGLIFKGAKKAEK